MAGETTSRWTDARFDELAQQGDPLADEVIAEHARVAGLEHPAHLVADIGKHLVLPPDRRSPAIHQYLEDRPPLPDWVDPQYVRPSPRPPTVEYRRIWVEPVYRVTCRRVWTERVVRVEYERVWVAPRYEMHDLVCWENGVQIIRRERVCVEPGHWDTQRREVVVSPGGWQTLEDRDLISGGYWKLERT